MKKFKKGDIVYQACSPKKFTLILFMLHDKYKSISVFARTQDRASSHPSRTAWRPNSETFHDKYEVLCNYWDIPESINKRGIFNMLSGEDESTINFAMDMLRSFKK